MSSLYIHIPFCKQACHYCDFHFSTNLKLKNEIIDSIIKEIQLQKDYLSGRSLSSIYFGGGTPSLLSISELSKIFETISQHYQFDQSTEITLEGNPDDLSPTKLKELSQTPINRLSIGVQSFDESNLRLLNRAHHPQDALSSIKSAQDLGIDNITIDLIYGIPSQSHDIWLQDLQTVQSLDIKHLSAYGLTIEPKTVFAHWEKQNKITMDEEFAAQQMEYLMAFAKDNHYQHYEISNFCQEGYYSRHNSNYWSRGDYLGIGPSAHSYNHTSRQYNISNNAIYVKSLKKNQIPATIEQLSRADQCNDYLLTSLRTMWGTSLLRLDEIYPDYSQIHKHSIQKYLASNHILLHDQHIVLSDSGKMIADTITAELFV